MLRILGKASSINVRKVLWTCAVIGRPLTREDWGSGFAATDAAEFLALNPNGLVPVLVDGATVLWESNTICRYLAAQARRHDLLPADATSRARVEQWMDWQATELNTAWRGAFIGLVRQDPAHADPARITASTREWNRLMRILDAQLARTGAHVAGDDFTLADIVLGLSTQRWLMTPIERPALPAVAAWFTQLAVQPGFAGHVANGIP